MIGRFRAARELGGRPRTVLARERERIRPLVPRGILELTGASSLPAALTVGDIDLHLRVPPEDFAAAARALRVVYDVVLPEIWTDTLSTFRVRGDDPVGVALTPIGSQHDRRFRTAWERLRRDASVLARYNEMKAAHANAPDAGYLTAKAAFFDDLELEG